MKCPGWKCCDNWPLCTKDYCKEVAYNLDLTKPIALRNGDEVRVVVIDLYIYGYSKHNNTWSNRIWRLDGSILSEVSAFDIVNTEPEVYQYLNVYENEEGLCIPGCIHDLRQYADSFAEINNKKRVGCMKIKLERRFDE